MARDFVSELKERAGRAELRKYNLRDFERLKAGAFRVSIQASRTHYSTPRETLPSADHYSAFEVAIFDADDNWVSPRKDRRLRDKPWAELFEDADVAVAGYVPRETIAQILEDLANAKADGTEGAP